MPRAPFEEYACPIRESQINGVEEVVDTKERFEIRRRRVDMKRRRCEKFRGRKQRVREEPWFDLFE
jgi:hypothetical protein